MKPSAGHLILVEEHHSDGLWLNSPRGTVGRNSWKGLTVRVSEIWKLPITDLTALR